METFKVKWTACDGYVSGDRPQYVDIPVDELLECESDAEINDLITQYVQDAFEQKVSPSWEEDDSLALAKKAIAAAREAESQELRDSGAAIPFEKLGDDPSASSHFEKIEGGAGLTVFVSRNV